MAFSHGSKQKLYLNGADISRFLRSIAVTDAADTAETSGLGTTDKSYIPGLRESRAVSDGMFDGSPAAADEIFKGILGDVTKDPTTPFAPGGSKGATFSHCVQGDIFGKVCYGFQGFAAQYNVQTEIGSVAAIHLESQGNSGYERMFVFHPFAGEAIAGLSTAIDFLLAGVEAVAFIQSGAIPALGITLQWRHSTDNITYVDLGSPIVLVPGSPGGQRISYVGTIRRYVKLQWLAPGGASLPFHAAFGRKS